MSVSKRLRFEILRRDNHACRYCGATAAEGPLTIDHVLAVALGGTDEASNLVTACSWPDCEMCESDEDEDHGDICLTCAGHGCEESCGLTGGCEHVSAGPYSHKVCVRCSGSGVVR